MKIRAVLAAFLLWPALWPGALLAEPAPALPSGVAPLPEALESRVEALLEEAEKYRGLQAREPVPSGTVDDQALKKKVVESFQTDMPPEKLRPVEAALKAFGLVPESLDLVKFFPDLLTSQVAGYYDPERHYLALVQRDGEILPSTDLPDLPADTVKKAEEAVLVHELTHALQDQHFHLETFATGQPLDDADAAKVALVEGDATLVMMDFFAETSLASLPGMEEAMGSFLEDPREMMKTAPGVPGVADLSSAPPWFQDTLLFSYFQGFQFSLSARRKGGQALLDHAFTTDPPRSSEQILHPEKWHTKRDDPVVIPWPDLSRTLPGWSSVTEAQLGELGIRTLFRGALKKDERAAQAAAGWGGDRFGVYQKEGERLLAWVTEWDTDADAREFQGAAKDLGRGWTVQRSERRVVVIRGNLKKPERAALQAELAAVRAERPANRGIDLAAIGIEAKKEEDTAAELMKNPKVKEAVEQILAQDLGQGELGEDGRTYSNATLGFSISIPMSQDGWELSPASGQAGVAAMLHAPDRSANVAVIHLPIGQPVDIAAIGPMIEIGMRMPMADYKQIAAGVVERGGVKVYEVEFEALLEGRPVRALQRFFAQGTNLLMVGGYVTPPEQWKKREKPVLETLDSFVLREPVSTPK
ncbi:MAG TPA: hypothetical protein VN493_18095 [Thermoanaerobaculia bacterium]|nr:hypothetical protein [Thermoanaerobaculia bacterium]